MTHFSTVGIVGLGLIGGSIAALIKKNAPNTTIIGVDTNTNTCQYATQHQLVDTASSSLDSLSHTDLVFVCTPINTVVSTILTLDQQLPKHTIITDVASVKQTITNTLSQQPLSHTIIPGHPIGGYDQAGITHANARHLHRASFIITPLSTVPDTFTSFLTQLSFNVVQLSAETHDQLIALTSHLPYLTSIILTNAFNQNKTHPALPHVLGPGAKDTTRLSQSPLEWGQSICQHNQAELIPLLKYIQSTTTQLLHALESQDTESIHTLLSNAKQLREQLPF